MFIVVCVDAGHGNYRAVALGKGSLVKIDIKSAYRLVPVQPQDRKSGFHTGFFFLGGGKSLGRRGGGPHV